METLSHNDILALNNAIGEIYAARDLETFYSSVFSSIRDMISYENCSYNDIEIKTIRFLKIITSSHDHNDVTQKLLPIFNEYAHEHPLAPHSFSDKVVKTTDVVSTSEFKGLAIYNEFYRHLDTEIQITLSIPVSPQIMALFVLSRKRSDFIERDRLLLTLLKPHLTNALRNVNEFGRLKLERDLLRKGAEEQRQGVLLCRQDGMIICISELAREMCCRYFAVALSEGDTLPGTLARWFETEAGDTGTTRRPGRRAERVERDAFIVEKDCKRLIIKLMNDVTSGDYLLCMTETDPAVLFRNLHRYGLSPRETEVVCWLAKGKTNVEIAVILNMSKRTTDKHLEHIFAKLNVETRAAVVAIILNGRNFN
jgi:DNA-binding CsgD family transcriptional regulator